MYCNGLKKTVAHEALNMRLSYGSARIKSGQVVGDLSRTHILTILIRNRRISDLTGTNKTKEKIVPCSTPTIVQE